MDADYHLVNKAFCDCVDRGQHKRRYFSKLKPGTVLCEVWHSFGLIGNGGFHNFFGGIGKRRVHQFIQSYDIMGAPKIAELIEEAYQLFDQARRSVDEPEDIDVVRKRCDSRMTEIERDYYGSESELVRAAAQYVRANPSSFSG